MTLIVNMQASLTEEDQRTFGFDMRGLHWPTYLDIYCQVSKQHVILDPKKQCDHPQGIRDFVFRDSSESQVACRRRLKWLNLLDVVVKVGRSSN